METHENVRVTDFDARESLLLSMLSGLGPSANGRGNLGAIYRDLEQRRPGSLDQAHARLTATRLGLQLRSRPDTALSDMSFLVYAGA